MPSLPKAILTNTATSKKRPLSGNAFSSIAKRPSTQGGFIISSDEDEDNEESTDDDDNDCHLVSSKQLSQQGVASSKTSNQQAVVSKASASIQEPLTAEPTKAPFPTKQLNKARLNALLGRNGKLKQTTRKALPSSTATQSSQRSLNTAASNELAESSNKPVTLPQTLGNSLLGVRPSRAANSAVEPQKNSPRQYGFLRTPGNAATIKTINEAKGKEAALTVRPHGAVDKEKGQQKSFPALKPAAMQAITKFQSESKSGTPLQLTTPSSVANLGSKNQKFSNPEPTILQSEPQHKENKPKIEQQISEVHSTCIESTKSDPCSFEQTSQEDAPDTDNNGAGDITAAALQKPVPYLLGSPISPRIKQENLKSDETISSGSEKGSEVVAAKPSPPVASDVTSDEATNVSSEALVLPRCELSKDAQPYFEYSIFRKDWSSEQDENEASTKEIFLHRFTDVLEANTQAERLFQSEKHPSYLIVECSTKRDEHGCIVLTSSRALYDHLAHKHHTKIYVQRDYVSKFANQSPQSLRGTTFISGTVYVLRLFKLIEVPDAVNSDDSDSDSGSDTAAARDPIRAYHPHDRPEVYTTLEAANRAAKNLQVQLSHEKEPKNAMNKVFQEQDLKKLDEKVRELEAAGVDKDRCWRSKFNAFGLRGDKLELVVEKVGICGPRNI